MPIAMDISNFSGDIKGKGPALRDHARKLIIGTQDVDIAKAQIDEAKKSCFEIELYQMTYFSVPNKREMDKMLAVHQYAFDQTQKAPFVHFDVEDAFRQIYTPPLLGYEVSNDMVAGWVQWVLFQAEDALGSVGVYTRRTWWEQYIADVALELGALPLWDADPDDNASLDGFTPYGPWKTRTMKQYVENISIEGVACNLSVY